MVVSLFADDNALYGTAHAIANDAAYSEVAARTVGFWGTQSRVATRHDYVYITAR